MLRDKEPLLGTFVLLPRPEIVEMLSLAGFDAIVVDLEHGPIDVSDLPSLVAAAQGSGLQTVVRVPDAAPAMIGRALDSGADGLLVPHVTSRVEAEAVVAAGSFPPVGERSINPYVRSNGYGIRAAASPQPALIAMLEGPDAIADLAEIAGVDGIDAVFVGPVDLAASLGFDGDATHPEVSRLVAETITAIVAGGGRASVYAPTPELAARWFDAGASLVALSADSAMVLSGFAEYVRAVGRDTR
jgi:2-keto-3-deoxy-L-rhamnonate aldolase RhmA